MGICLKEDEMRPSINYAVIAQINNFVLQRASYVLTLYNLFPALIFEFFQGTWICRVFKSVLYF